MKNIPAAVGAAVAAVSMLLLVFTQSDLRAAEERNETLLGERSELASELDRVEDLRAAAEAAVGEAQRATVTLEAQLEDVTADRDRLVRLAAATEQRVEDLEVELAQALPAADGLTLAQQDRIWFAVFGALTPGANLDTARSVLQCESGGTANPHTVVSRTVDVGRAQINKAAHAGKVSARWPSLSFEEAMGDPARNAVMAAVIYNDAGSWAPWACWWIGQGRPVPWKVG